MANEPSRRHTVLVVDDSPLFRRVVGDLLAESGDLVVVGEAGDGVEAVERVRQLAPDLVTLDLDMPAMGGLDALGVIMREAPRAVVVLSGHAPPQGGDLTIRALELGAVDFVRKPSGAAGLDVDALRRRLLQALREAAGGRVMPLGPAPLAGSRGARPAPGGPATGSPPRAPATGVIAIAASTGGPRTLAELVPRLPAEIDAAIVIVQHMPAGFTASLARRLNELGPRPVEECRDGMPLRAGRVYVAPGGLHTTVSVTGGTGRRFRLDGSPPVHGVRPAADVTFASLAGAFGDRAVAVVLTGMGRDGAAGAAAVRERGGAVVVQDPETCVVGGMGQAVMAVAGADAVVAPGLIPDALRRLCAGSRPRA